MEEQKIRQLANEIIAEADWARWLGPLADHDIQSMLGMYPDDNMQAKEFELTKSPPPNPSDIIGPLTLF